MAVKNITNVIPSRKENISDVVSKKLAMTKVVTYSIKPALIYECCFGIFRLSFDDHKLSHTTLKQKIIGILIAVFFIVTFAVLISIPRSFGDTKEIVNMMDEVPTTFTLFQYVTTIITTSFFINEPTMRIFNNLADIDTKLRLDQKESFYNNTGKNIRNCLLLLTFVIIFSSVIDVLTDEKILLYKFVSTSLYLQQNLEILMFCQMVLLIRSRVGVINEYLGMLVDSRESYICTIFVVKTEKPILEKQYNFIGRISESNSRVRDLAELYDALGDTCSLINQVFQFQLFMNLVSTFTYTVIAIWTSLYYSRAPENFSGQLVTVILWCTVTMLSVAIMSFTCERLLGTRNDTRLLVNSIIMDYDLPKTMRVQAKVFMELIEACQMQIVVYDMFSIDIKLLLKFVSVATTYLIVIIQLSHFLE